MRNNENVHHCTHCNAEIHGEDYTEFDGEILFVTSTPVRRKGQSRF